MGEFTRIDAGERVNIDSEPSRPLTVTNYGPDVSYYGDSVVSAINKVGSLAKDASMTIPPGYWFTSAGRSRLYQAAVASAPQSDPEPDLSGSAGSGSGDFNAPKGLPQLSKGKVRYLPAWLPATDYGVIGPDTLFFSGFRDEQDALDKGIRLSAQVLNYNTERHASLTPSPHTNGRKVIEPAVDTYDFGCCGADGILPLDQFTVEIGVLARGSDFVDQAYAGNTYLFSIERGNCSLKVYRNSATTILARLSIDGLTNADSTLTVASGDLPQDTLKVISVIWTGTVLKTMLGNNTKSNTGSAPTGTADPHPFGGFASVFIGGWSGGQPIQLLAVDSVHIKRWARTYTTAGNFKLATITVDPSTTQGAFPQDVAGVMGQYAGWRDTAADGQDVGNGARDAIIAACAAAGAGVARIDHVFDKVTVGGTAGSPTVSDWSDLDGAMDELHAAGFKFHITLDYTPAVLGATSATPPTNNSGYAILCSAAVTHWLVKGYQLHSLSLWNEPDLSNFWNGTKSQLADLWATVRAKLATDFSANPLVPTLDTVEESGNWSGTGWTAAIIDRAATDGVPLGRIWVHHYDDQAQLAKKVRAARAYAATKGFSSIDIGVGEWSIGAQVTASGSIYTFRDYYGDEYHAGFTFAMLHDFIHEDVDTGIYTRLGIIDPAFVSDPIDGLFDYQDPPRPLPSFAAMQAFWALQGTRVSAVSNWPAVRTLAAVADDDVVRVGYCTLRSVNPAGSIEIGLEWDGADLPAEFTWKQWRCDRTTMPEGRLVLVGSGNESNLPTGDRLSAAGVGLIEVTP